MGTAEDIAEVLAPTARAAGLEIWDVVRAGGSVRVLVDGPGGVDLDTIAALSRAVSAILEGRDDLVPAGHYLLEVSSPGIERRLRKPEHFARYVGSNVAVRTTEPVGGSRRLQGTLLASDANVITLLRQDEDKSAGRDEVSIPLGCIERAHPVFDWGDVAKAKPGTGGALRRAGAALESGVA